MRPVLAFPLLAALAIAPGHAHADEGMWPFNMVPKDSIQKDHGVALSDAWLDHLRLASVRFNGVGSGSFVSAKGLVLTNHHVASDCIAKLARPGKDFHADGYVAGIDGPEAKCPDLELNQLVGMDDVTDKVLAAKTAGMNDAEANKAMKGTMAQLEKDCTDKTGLRCDVITLYAGGKYHLYKYKKYTDIRLVFAPEFEVAFFGGDPDNFTYPRYDYDLALFRVYEGDKPITPKDYLKWNPAGPKEGDTVFVSGHPAGTERMDTVAQVECIRDVTYAYYLGMLHRDRALLVEFAKAGGPEAEREVREQVFGIDNSIKAISGEVAGLRDPALVKKKKDAEAALRKAVDADPKLKASYGTVWDDIARAQKALASMYKRYAALERGDRRSDLLHVARDLVRLPHELATPNDQRLREYRESNLESLKLQLLSPAPVYGGVEAALLRSWLERIVRDLGPNDALVKKVLAGRTPARATQEMIAGSKLADVYARRKLLDGGQAAVDASTDPLIVFMRTIDEDARAVRKRYEDEVEGPMRKEGQRVAQAVFAVKGTSVYPDATFTLRLSVGVVKGYVERGKTIPWSTDFAGMFKHATGKDPYKLPQRWLDKKPALKLDTPLNLVSTNDIIGGNSGSPLVDANGALVGLIFDGNLSSLPNDFVYEETTQRAVSVDTAGILEAMSHVFGASALVAELLQ